MQSHKNKLASLAQQKVKEGSQDELLWLLAVRPYTFALKSYFSESTKQIQLKLYRNEICLILYQRYYNIDLTSRKLGHQINTYVKALT